MTSIPTHNVIPAPSVSALNPTSGPTAGGNSVVISGTNLVGAADILGSARAAVTGNTNTQITAIAPAGSGTVDVTVTTAAGTSAISAADRYTYTAVTPAPTVTGLSPTSGPTGGGNSVVISGSNLGGATSVRFGSAPATVTGNTNTQITAIAPAGSGTVDVGP